MRRLVLLIGTAMVAAAAGAALTWLLLQPAGAVPEVRGLPLPQARAALVASGHRWIKTTLRRPDSTIVTQQSPQPGTLAPSLQPVALRVSSSAVTVTVPSVVGLTYADASDALRGELALVPQHLGPKSFFVTTSTPPAGAVVPIGTVVGLRGVLMHGYPTGQNWHELHASVVARYGAGRFGCLHTGCHANGCRPCHNSSIYRELAR